MRLIVPHVDPIMVSPDTALIVTNDSGTQQMRLHLINIFTGAQVGYRELLFGEASRIGVDVVSSWLHSDPDDDAVVCDISGVPQDLFSASPAMPGS
jgi:hypothetical protein